MTEAPRPVDSESAHEPQKKELFPLSAQIIAAMILGLILGPLIGKGSSLFAEVAKLVIQVIKAAATPLLFLAIVNAIVKSDVSMRAGARMIGFALLNASIALSLGLILSNVIRPGDHMALALTEGQGAVPVNDYAGKKIDFTKTIVSHIPQNVVSPFIENAVIAVVILALLFGFGLRRARSEQIATGASGYSVVEDILTTLQRVTEVVLMWVIRLVPLAVFAVVTRTVGQYGYAPFKGLGWYVGVGLVGLFLQIVVTYQAWIVFKTKLTLKQFWREAKHPVIYAVGANSSLATLPITLRALDRLGVSRASSALGACVGTNLNNDGILLYEGMAVLFVAQASGMNLTISQQIVTGITCMVAAMGVAGVPEAGFISLALVLNTVGLPVELLPLLLTVDWVVARARSVTNVLSDMMLSILVDSK